MKKLVLVALCSTSLLSIARAEGGGNMGSGGSMQQGGAMSAGDDARHAGGMAADSTQEAREKTKKAKRKAKQAADAHMKSDGMDHGAMQHDGQMDGGTK